MSFHDWETTVKPKVDGSWNLHAELPKGLDFFIMFSSIMGILGSGSLSAYNAGNTYQDALAQYRISRGERAIALNLGGIPDAGYLTDHTDQLEMFYVSEKFTPVYTKEVYALLDIFCNPENTVSASLPSPQVIIGIRPPAHWRHIEEVPFTMQQPFWGHMHHVAPLSSVSDEGNDRVAPAKQERAHHIARRLATTGSLVEAAEMVCEALKHRVSLLLGTTADRLEEQQPMDSFGVDSLSASSIRNWIYKTYNVDVPIFEIIGGGTLGSVSRAVALKTQIKSSV